MILLFDVDGTVVNTPELWLNWISSKTKNKFSRNNMKYYESFEEQFSKINTNIDLYDFWRQSDLYDNLTPYKQSVLFYKELKKGKHQVLFVSHSNIFPEHIRSKKAFLRKYFPDLDGFISTDKKEMVRGDVLVDDCPNHLLKYKEQNPASVCILSQQFYNKLTKSNEKTKDLFDTVNFNDNKKANFKLK